MRRKTFKVSQTKWERKYRNRKQNNSKNGSMGCLQILCSQMRLKYRPQALIYTKIGIELQCKSISYKGSLFSR